MGGNLAVTSVDHIRGALRLRRCAHTLRTNGENNHGIPFVLAVSPQARSRRALCLSLSKVLPLAIAKPGGTSVGVIEDIHTNNGYQASRVQ